jgi:hypothetical protein
MNSEELSAVFHLGSFLKLCCFCREKKLIVLDFSLELIIDFEKRAANLIRMHKIALSTLKSAFGF